MLKNRFRYTLLMAVLFCGCGGNSNLATVSGKVTLDGAPVADATITFSPKATGSSAVTRTDAQGSYSLRQTKALEGAAPGQYSVKISTYQMANPDAEPPLPAIPEKIPLKYNFQSELVKEIKAGDNTIDFELKSDGPIVQPKPTVD